ncbi:MAG: radical SAM protein [Candidatus Hydrogenedentota bacterium]
MKLLFLQPTYYHDAECKDVYSLVPPISLAAMASIAQKRGHLCQILDIMGRDTLLNKAVNTFSPDIICVTSFTTNYRDAVMLIKRLRKEYNFDGKIIYGGVHVTLEPEKSVNQCGADILVVGEGEETFEELLDAIENNKDLTQVPGLCLPGHGRTAPRRYLKGLDELPRPAYELLESGKNSPYSTSVIFVEVHRGCPYTCSYCSSKYLYGSTLRARSPQKVSEDIRYLKENLGMKEWEPVSDTFVFNLVWLKEFAELVGPLGMRHRANGKFNVMKEETLDYLKQSGCYQVDYGVESAVPKVLKNIDKFTDMKVAEEVIKMTADKGFDVHLYFMLSLPGETYDDMMTTLDFAKRMKQAYGASTEFQITRIYPDTPLKTMWAQEVEDWTEIRHPNLPYPSIPAYYELDPDRVFETWKQACAEIKSRTTLEHLKKTIPEMYRSARSPQQFVYQFSKRATRKALQWIETRLA